MNENKTIYTTSDIHIVTIGGDDISCTVLDLTQDQIAELNTFVNNINKSINYVKAYMLTDTRVNEAVSMVDNFATVIEDCIGEPECKGLDKTL